MQHERSPISSVPCQRNTWRFPNELGAMPAQHMKVPNELSAMPAQYMKAPEQARCHVSAIHEGSRTSSETQKLLVQAIEETVRNVKFFLKANSVIEEQKSTVRFAGTCSWSDCISSPNISSFVGHGLMNGAVPPCSAFTSRVKVRMYMSLCLHVIAGFTHTQTQTHTHTFLHTNTFTHRPSYTQTETFTHKPFYTQTLWHRNPLTHRSCDTRTPFTHRPSYTQTLTLLHSHPFTSNTS